MPAFGLVTRWEQACLVVLCILGLRAWGPAPAEHLGYVFAFLDTTLGTPNFFGSLNGPLFITGVAGVGDLGGCALPRGPRRGRLPRRVLCPLYFTSVLYGLYMACIYGCMWAVCNVCVLYSAI